MKKIGIVLLLYSLSLAASAQVHVWCPKPVAKNTRSTGLHGKEINLIVYDARQITDQTYVECPTADVVQAFTNRVKAEFADVSFRVLTDSASYFGSPADNGTTVKLGIAAYHTGLGPDALQAVGLKDRGFKMEVPKNNWTSLVGLRVQISKADSTGTKTRSKDISSVVNRPDITGQITAKKTLAESYKDAMAEAIKFIDSLSSF